MTDASPQTLSPRPKPEPGRRSIDPARGLRVEPSGPGPPDLALRFTDRDREDLPRVALPAGQLTLLEGRAGVEAVRQRLIVDCATRGRSVIQIVGGNRLDSNGLARRAQALGLDPGYVLRTSMIARGFTAYQLSVLVEERLPAHLASADETALAIVSDPLALYTDEDVRRTEGRRLAEQALASLVRTADDHACPVLVIQPPAGQRGGRPSPRARNPTPMREDPELDRMLAAHADRYVRLLIRDGARVLELPARGDRYRIADPRPQQTQLDRFAASSPARDEGGRSQRAGRAPAVVGEGPGG